MEGVWFVQFLEGMSEKIKKGIEAAQTDLIKEKEQKAQEEVCIARHILYCFSVVSFSCVLDSYVAKS